MKPSEDPTRRQLQDDGPRTMVRSSDTVANQVAEESLEDRIKRKLSDHDESTGVVERSDPLIGVTINQRFFITSKIGAGGMGAVYRAKQLGMNRDVAIKVLLRELTENETVLRRFHLEALAVSKLKHPNTIQIFDFGETEDGLLYIAMELLEGKPLQKVLTEEHQVSVRRALHIIEQVSKSLREAHSKGIVHRDLKPDNIFLQAVGEDADYAKVLDFGVAKVAEGDGQGKTLTKAGSIFGTPKYMSPEQSRGTEIDARSDIYALGVILYEMLCGRVPFNAENPLGILIKHIQEAPPPFQEMRPDLVIPEQVELFVHRLLAKSVEQRPQTTEAVIRECEKLLAELPPLFRNVVTRADVEAAGIEVATLSVTSFDTQLGLGNKTISSVNTVQNLQAPRRKWPFIVIAALLLLVGSAGALYASLSPLDKSYYAFTTIDELKIGQVEEFNVDSVVVNLVSVPDGATVLNQNNLIVGQTPFTLRRNKGSASERYTLRLDGHRDYARAIDFDNDEAVVATLEKVAIEPPPTVLQPKPPEVKVPVAKPPEGKPPEGKPPEGKPQEPVKVPETKPNPWDGPKKVNETKDNPYGGGAPKQPDSVKDNPY